MIAMARRAGRRTQVPAHRERFVVHAGTVRGELVRRNRIRLHVGSVGMASRARLRDVQRMHLGARVAGRADVMHAVTIRADGDFVIALGAELPMHAGLIQAVLIGAQRRIVLAHERAISMAMRAERGHILAADVSAEASGFAHGGIIRFRGISAVTGSTGEAFLGVDVRGKLRFGHLKGRIQRGVATQTTVRGLRVTEHRQGQNTNK